MSRRLGLGVVFGLALGLGGSSLAFAQAPGQGPPMPMAIDLAKVATGSWADYSMAMGQLPPMKMRLALVNKTADANVVETIVEGGMMAAAGKMVMQMTLAPGAEGKPKKMLMQLGAGDPMDMPVEMTGGKPFTKPNPKNLVGSESIKTAAGSFKTKHYRDKSPQGDKMDYWVSDTVPPMGLVKVEIEQKNNPQIKGPLKFELTGLGKDAKPSITKPGKPFDQAALMQQMMGASGAAAGGKAGPSPAPGSKAGPAPAPGSAPAAAPAPAPKK
jgi:hypothetical protein